MPDHDHSRHHAPQKSNFPRSRAALVLLGFLAIAGFLLFTDHRPHLLGVVIWLLPLACLLLHMFMHGHSDDRRAS